MDLTPSQQNKIIKLAEHSDSPELSTLTNLIEIQDSLAELKDTPQALKDIKDTLEAIEIPEAVDHTDQLQAILDKLNEPEVEDTIEVSLNII